MNMLKTSLEYWIPSCYRGYDHSMHDSTFLRSFQGYKRLYFVSGTRLCPVSQQTISLLSQHFFLWKRTAWLCRVVNYLLRRGSLSRAVGVNDPSRLTLHHNYIKRRWNVHIYKFSNLIYPNHYLVRLQLHLKLSWMKLG